ncbi:MAG: hypothetical protein QM737_02820 [Ferruginibacter sp.]
MALHRTKGAKMQVQTKQELREEIKRQHTIIDQLLKTIVAQQKDIATIKECMQDVTTVRDVRVSNTANTIREKLQSGDFLPQTNKPFSDFKTEIRNLLDEAAKAKEQFGNDSEEYKLQQNKINQVAAAFANHAENPFKAYITDKDLQDHQDKQTFYNNLGKV